MQGKEIAMTELTPEQVQALEAQKPAPLQLVNPATREVYVLISKEIYDLTCGIVGGANRRGWDDPELDVYERYRKHKP
jgi:hypothetical protein